MRAFSNIHPITAMVYFISILLFSMFSNNPVIGVLALMGGILFCMMLTGRKEKWSDIKFYLTLFLLITITNPLFSHNGKTPLFFMNGNAVTLEAVIYGVAIAVMVVSVLMWCKSYGLIMTSDKFVYLFGRAIPKISLVLSTVLRYVPMLKRQAKKVNRTQKAMGFYTSESYAERLRLGMRVFSALITWSLENAVETGKVMKARGYGLKGHTNYSNFVFRKRDGILFVVILVLDAITLAAMLTGQLDFFYYPEITDIICTLQAMTSYICFGVLSFLPFIIEVEEIVRWKYYRLKI